MGAGGTHVLTLSSALGRSGAFNLRENYNGGETLVRWISPRTCDINFGHSEMGMRPFEKGGRADNALQYTTLRHYNQGLFCSRRPLLQHGVHASHNGSTGNGALFW